MGQPLKTFTVEVQIPQDRAAQNDQRALGAQLRALWAIEQVRLQRCGVGKGAELADMPRAAFMQLLGEHGVPVIDYSVEDLHEELLALDHS